MRSRDADHRCRTCGDYLPALSVEDLEKGVTPSSLCPPCSRTDVIKARAKAAKAEGREPMQRTVRPDQETRNVKLARKLLERMEQEKNPPCQRRVLLKKRGVAPTKVMCGRPESEHPVGRCPSFLGVSPREERRLAMEARKAARLAKARAKAEAKAIKEHRKAVEASLKRQAERKTQDAEALKRGWQCFGFHAHATRRVKVGVSKQGRSLLKAKGKPLCGAKVRKDAVLVRGEVPQCQGCVAIVEGLNQKREEKIVKKQQKAEKGTKKAKGAKAVKKAKGKSQRTGVKDWFRGFMKAKPSVTRESVIKAGAKFGDSGVNSIRAYLSSIKSSNKILGFVMVESEGVFKRKAGTGAKAKKAAAKKAVVK